MVRPLTPALYFILFMSAARSVRGTRAKYLMKSVCLIWIAPFTILKAQQVLFFLDPRVILNIDSSLIDEMGDCAVCPKMISICLFILYCAHEWFTTPLVPALLLLRCGRWRVICKYLVWYYSWHMSIATVATLNTQQFFAIIHNWHCNKCHTENIIYLFAIFLELWDILIQMFCYFRNQKH